ncbi:MAG: nucleoid-associated protein [Methanoregula sp.]|nr:nucleoid-associated protein [Methanoregula sp.]
MNDLFSKFSNGELKENVKTDAFLNHSILMAHNLDMSQDERSTSGVLCVMYGNVEEKKVIIIAKLEEGQDLQIQELKENDVFIRLDIKIIDNIVRLNKTNVLKVGIFYKEPKKPHSLAEPDIKSYLCDTQNLERKSADYYLKKFLGCLYTQDPKFQTQEFYNAAFDFISTHIEDPREQVLYRDHLYSYLLSQKTTIEPKNFIQTYFPADKKMATELENQFKSRKIELNGFPKDTEHVRKQVEKMKVLFENGVTLMGASANFASEVIIESSDETSTKLTVKSKISKMPLKVTRKRTVKDKTSEEE